MINIIRNILIRLEVVVALITLLIALVIIFVTDILPYNGIHVIFNMDGHSMDPALVEHTLLIAKEVPFEELEVGDIIIFREWKNSNIMSKSITINNTKKKLDDDSADDDDADTAADTAADITAGSNADDNGETDIPAGSEHKDAITGKDSTLDVFDAVYDPDSVFLDKDIVYNDEENTVHRIVRINENGDRAIITKGDNNDGIDPRPVMKSGYRYKSIWYKHDLAILFEIIFETSMFEWFIAATLSLGIIIFILTLASRPMEGTE